MSESSHATQPNPRRLAYISGGGYFIYFPYKEMWGTNRRNPVSPDLARIALMGIDAHDSKISHAEDAEPVSGLVEEVFDRDNKVVAIRVDNPKLALEGLKECMNLPFTDITPDMRGLAHWAARDLYAFIQDLAIQGVLDPK